MGACKPMVPSREHRYRLSDPIVRVAPSLLAADFARLRDEIQAIEAAGAEILHLDVMDGHFVPNISFGVPVVESIRAVTDLYLDTHLMIADPLKYAEPFRKAGSDSITFHIEVPDQPHKIIDRIRDLGADVGVSLNPDTSPEDLDPVLDAVDLVLVMSVWPGFGGQTFISGALDKCKILHSKLAPSQRLEIDGGINFQTITSAVEAGADILVAGSTIFGAERSALAYNELLDRARSLGDNP